MTYPFNKPAHVTSTFQDHLNEPSRAMFPGVDYAGYPMYGDPILAPEDGGLRAWIDGNGTVYAVVIANSGYRWDFLHCKSVEAENTHILKPVKEGDVIGYVGNTGYVFPKPTPDNPYAGTHCHVSYRGPGGNFIDVEPILNNLLSHPHMPEIDQKVTELETQLATTKATLSQIQDLQNKLLNQNNKLQDTISQKTTENEGYKNIIAQNEATVAQERVEMAKLTDELTKLRNSAKVALGIDAGSLVTDIVSESVSGSGLMERWCNFVEKHFKSKRLQSIFKYDIFVVIGILLGAPTLGVILSQAGLPSNVIAGIVFVAGVAFKLLLTTYDTNKDGKLDLADTQVLKSYAISPNEPQEVGTAGYVGVGRS